MKTSVLITAIICIAALEAIALSKGINGAMLTLAVAVIAGIAGVVIPTPKFLKGGSQNG